MCIQSRLTAQHPAPSGERPISARRTGGHGIHLQSPGAPSRMRTHRTSTLSISRSVLIS
jgi:hypothetical protein